jgi:hypothetical protein
VSASRLSRARGGGAGRHTASRGARRSACRGRSSRRSRGTTSALCSAEAGPALTRHVTARTCHVTTGRGRARTAANGGGFVRGEGAVAPTRCTPVAAKKVAVSCTTLLIRGSRESRAVKRAAGKPHTTPRNGGARRTRPARSSSAEVCKAAHPARVDVRAHRPLRRHRKRLPARRARGVSPSGPRSAPAESR